MVAKINRIVSFGDSFILGSEIKDNHDGRLAWPGLIAQRLDLEYQTLAWPGCSNDAIARQIFTYFARNSCQGVLAVINWTWAMRWDFYLSKVKEWIGLGPTCAPEKLKDQLDREQATDLITIYQRYVGPAHEWNQYRSLQAIMAAQKFLEHNNIPNIQTYMDRELFMVPTTLSRLEHYNAFRDPAWPDVSTEADFNRLSAHIRDELDSDYYKISDPDYIQLMQKQVWPVMQDFDGQTFLEWSRGRGYKITPPPGDHPLIQAHQAAADHWQLKYQQFL